MKIARVQMPDGRIGKFEVPDDASEQDVTNFISQGTNINQTQEIAPQPIDISNQVAPVADIKPRSTNPFSKDNFTWGQVAREAISNIPSSAMQMASDISSALAHPIQTAKGIGNIGIGAAQKLIPGEQGKEQYANQVGEFFKHRYGGVENLKRTIAKDPVGVVSDLSTILTGGGIAATKVPRLAKAAEISKVVGTKLAPFMQAGRALGKVAPALGKGASEVLGVTTGVGSEAIKQAFKSGIDSGNEFIKSLRGKVDPSEIVEGAKKGISNLRKESSAEYVKSMDVLKSDPTRLDFNPIKDAFNKVVDSSKFEGISVADDAAKKLLKEAGNKIAEFSSNPNTHNAFGLDKLKQSINNISVPIENRNAMRIKSELSKSIGDVIEAQHPQYRDIMANYGKQAEQAKNIEKSLSLGKKAGEETSLRKLQSALKDNVQTDYKYRQNALDLLEKYSGNDLKSSLAGQALSSIPPRGLLGSSLGGGVSIGAIMSNPALLTTLPAFSPRAVGEVSYKLGQSGKLVKKIPAKKISKTGFQYGRIENEKD